MSQGRGACAAAGAAAKARAAPNTAARSLDFRILDFEACNTGASRGFAVSVIVKLIQDGAACEALLDLIAREKFASHPPSRRLNPP